MPANYDEELNGRLQTLDAGEASDFVHRDELKLHPDFPESRNPGPVALLPVGQEMPDFGVIHALCLRVGAAVTFAQEGEVRGFGCFKETFSGGSQIRR